MVGECVANYYRMIVCQLKLEVRKRFGNFPEIRSWDLKENDGHMKFEEERFL